MPIASTSFTLVYFSTIEPFHLSSLLRQGDPVREEEEEEEEEGREANADLYTPQRLRTDRSKLCLKILMPCHALSPPPHTNPQTIFLSPNPAVISQSL
jgi:hypothetical protein